MMNMKKHLKWLWVPVFGIISGMFLFLAIAFNGGGHGPFTPLVIVASPPIVLMWLSPPGAPALFVSYVPFYWMGEAVLALCRNKYSKWAFLILVPTKYIFTIFLLFFWDLAYKHHYELFNAGFIISVLTPYIAVQLFLWILFLHTWGRIRFVIPPAEPPSF